MDNGQNNGRNNGTVNTRQNTGDARTQSTARHTENGGRVNPQGANQRIRTTEGSPARAQTAERRPMTDEERSRLAAAGEAARRSGMTEAEINRRRAEAAYLQKMQEDSKASHTVSRTSGVGAADRQRRRTKKRSHINAGAVIFSLLIIGVIAASVVQLNKNNAAETPQKEQAVYENEDVGEALHTSDTSYSADGGETADDGEIWEEVESSSAENAGGDKSAEEAPVTSEADDTVGGNMVVTVSNASVCDGLLTLVNYMYPYAQTKQIETKNAYTDRTGRLKVAATDINLETEAFSALESMVEGMIADVDCHDLLITSGLRTVSEQQEIWDNYLTLYGEDYVKSYVAVPGYSEHHTGLACDLSFYTDAGESVSVANHQFGYWLGDNCMKYGFIRRYPEDKADITNIGYEAWHFRYVGIPSAYACTSLNLCLEEYTDYIRDYTAETKFLCVSADGDVTEAEIGTGLPDEGWIIYYTPMAEGENTDIDIPTGYDYVISGNNVDGFVTTVTMTRQ